MKKLLMLLLALLLAALPALALADDAELSVVGTATVVLKPDRASFSVGVETRADTVKAAVDSNNEVLNTVIAALGEAGVASEDMSTANYYVSTEYDYSVTPAKTIGYSVTNMLNVVVRDISQIGAVIDAATAAGANQVYGVTFYSSQADDSYDRALTLAIQEGMRKAQLMAIAAGRSLGALESLEEDVGTPSYAANAIYETAAAGDTAILPENLTISASVTLTYELK